MKLRAATGSKVQVAALFAIVALFRIEARAEVVPKELTNSFGMELVLIQPGTFDMGRGADPKLPDSAEADYDEQPAHPVTITKAIYMLHHKVSAAEYEK